VRPAIPIGLAKQMPQEEFLLEAALQGQAPLLNNEAHDGQPFFLTAHHVLDINRWWDLGFG